MSPGSEGLRQAANMGADRCLARRGEVVFKPDCSAVTRYRRWLARGPELHACYGLPRQRSWMDSRDKHSLKFQESPNQEPQHLRGVAQRIPVPRFLLGINGVPRSTCCAEVMGVMSRNITVRAAQV